MSKNYQTSVEYFNLLHVCTETINHFLSLSMPRLIHISTMLNIIRSANNILQNKKPNNDEKCVM